MKNVILFGLVTLFAASACAVDDVEELSDESAEAATEEGAAEETETDEAALTSVCHWNDFECSGNYGCRKPRIPARMDCGGKWVLKKKPNGCFRYVCREPAPVCPSVMAPRKDDCNGTWSLRKATPSALCPSWVCLK